MLSPISNAFIKVIFDDQTESQIVPNFLPQLFVRELQNCLVSDPNDGGLKDARDEKIISLSLILHYGHFSIANKINVRTIQGHVWLWMLHFY